MQHILSLVRRCVDDYHMIEAGETVAVGVSGGKDSVLTLAALARLREFHPKKFQVAAVTIDSGTPGMDFAPIAQLCRELGGRQDLVIACGGGLPMQDEAISALKGNGVVFWLDRDPGETYYGLDISGRPLAQGGREDFLARYAVRSPIYHRWADFIIVKPETPQCAENRISTIYTEVSEA